MASVIAAKDSHECDEQTLDGVEGTLNVAVDVQPILNAALARQRLIDLKLVESDQWDAAVEAAGSALELVPILNQLQHMESRWDSGCDEKFPVLTAFQTQKILVGKPEELWLDHYILLEKLGSGGMGDVFKARNTRLPRLEAIKTIHRDDDDPVDSALGIERFQREAQLLAQLHHSNLTTIYHAGQDRDVQFIAIEYVRGKNLKEYIDEQRNKGREMPVGTAVDYMITVAEVLVHAHKRDVIHRDVKPPNIMLTDDGGLKVLDLGIAQLRTPGKERENSSTVLTQGDIALGTPEVMAPEQWADAQSVTAASDIYSLGCTLFYTLTGRMPFVSRNREELLFAAISAPRPSATVLRSHVPNQLSAVIRKMLATLPHDRYQSCEEVIAALLPFSERSAKSRNAESGQLQVKSHLWTAAAVLMGSLAVSTFFQDANSATSFPPIDEDIRQGVETVAEELQTPFLNAHDPLPRMTTSNEEAVLAKYDYKSFMHLSEWLLQLQTTEGRYEDNLLDVETRVDGMLTKVVPVNGFARIRVRSKRAGFLTMLVFEGSGKLFRFHWTKPIEADQWLTLLETEATSAGTDTSILFLTDVDPLQMQDAPFRPLSAAPPKTWESEDNAQGMIYSRYSRDDLDKLQTAFSHPYVFDEVMKTLESGAPYPFKRRKSPAAWWSRTTFTLRVVDR